MSQPPGTPEALSKPPEVKPVKAAHELFPRLNQRDYERRDNKVRGVGSSVAEWYKTEWDGKPAIYKKYKSDYGGQWGFKETNEAYNRLHDLQGDCLPKHFTTVDGSEQAIVEEYIEEQEESVEAVMLCRFNAGSIREGTYQTPYGELPAKWLTGYLEGMSKIHGKGFVIGDFKFDDTVLTKDNRVVFRDLGNFEDPNNPEFKNRGGSVNFVGDLRNFGEAFIAMTQYGGAYQDARGDGFRIDYNAKIVLAPSNRYFWRDFSDQVAKDFPQAPDGNKPAFREVAEIISQAAMGELKDKSSLLVAEAKLKIALERFFVERGIVKGKPVEVSPQKPAGADQVAAARLAVVREELTQKGWPPRPGEPGYNEYADSRGWGRKFTPEEVKSAEIDMFEEYLKGLRLSTAYPGRFLQKYQEKGKYSLPYVETKCTKVWGLYYGKYINPPALEKGPDGSLRLPQSEPIEINRFLDSIEGKKLFTEKAKELGLDISKKEVEADLRPLLYAQISASRLNLYWNYSGRTNGDLAELYHRQNNFAQRKLAEIRAKTYV